MRTLAASLALLTLVSTAAMAQPGYPPIPAPEVESGPPPPPPGPEAQYVLVPGHWHWDGVRYDRWVARHWTIRRAGYGHFVPGAWRPRPYGGGSGSQNTGSVRGRNSTRPVI